MEWWSCVTSAVPLAAMVALECIEVGMSILSKAAMTKGMSSSVFVVYYSALSTVILLPFVVSSLFCRRERASLTISLLCRFFLLGLIGSLAQILACTGIKYSSPTLSSALGNLIPIFTYVLAIVFRMEDPNLRSSIGVAKFLGALVSVLGALIVTLYRGQQILVTSSSSEFPHQLLHSEQSYWVLGGLLLAISFFLAALLSIFQTAVVKDFPEKRIIVFFFCFFTTIICGSFSLIVERNPNAWKLRHDIELIAVTYSAIFIGVVLNSVRTWCLQERGPVFVSMFKPMGIAIAVVMGLLFLGDPLYIGSVIGGVIITLGFYTVMWAKAKEQTLVPSNGSCSFEVPSPERTPLLENNLEGKI